MSVDKNRQDQIKKIMASSNPDLRGTALIPGISVGFVNGSEVSTKEIGFTDKSCMTKVNSETIFGAASLSKPVFTYLVLKLVQNGILDLNQRLEIILPFNKFCKENEFTWTKSDANIKRLNSLNINMILSHTSGLDLPKEGPIRFLFEPGTEYAYSNLALYYLQKVIEAHTHSTLEELSQKYIFGTDALDMKHSTFYRKYELCLMSEDKRLAGKIYLNETSLGLQYEVIGLDGKLKNNVIAWNELPCDFPKKAVDIVSSQEKFLKILLHHTASEGHTTAPAPVAVNSLYTTAYDYGRFVKAWMNDPNEIMQKAFQPIIFLTKDAWAQELEVSTKDLEKVAWGLGFGLQINGERVVAYHSGDMNQWRAWVAMDLKNKTAIVYFANSKYGHLLAEQIISPNIELEHVFNYFFQKYGFARKIEPDWLKKEKAQLDHIDEYVKSRKGLDESDSEDELARSVFGQSSNTAKKLANEQVTAAKLMNKMGGPLAGRAANQFGQSSTIQELQETKDKSNIDESSQAAESKSIHGTPTLKPPGHK